MKAPVSRRQSLAALGGIGAAVLAAACGGTRPSRTPASAATAQAATPAGSPVACVLTPEAIQGPYYIDYARIRRDIRAGRPGARLDLHITVLDAISCSPLAGAAVDLWHADADGLYSGFEAASTGHGPPVATAGGISKPTDAHRFLRGTQLADPSGKVAFVTIYPGWYAGRAVHIHMKVHRGGSVVHTGQLFFKAGSGYAGAITVGVM